MKLIKKQKRVNNKKIQLFLMINFKIIIHFQNLCPNFLKILRKEGKELLYESLSSITHFPPKHKEAITEVIKIL